MQIIYTQTRTDWKCSWKGMFRCWTLLSCDIVLKVKRFSFTGPLFDKFRDVVKRNDSQAAKGRKVDKWKAVRNSFFVIIFAQPASGIKVIQRQAAGSVIDPLLCDSLRKKKKRKKYCMQTAWSDERGHCFLELHLQEVRHQSAHKCFSVSYRSLCSPMRGTGTAACQLRHC